MVEAIDLHNIPSNPAVNHQTRNYKQKLDTMAPREDHLYPPPPPQEPHPYQNGAKLFFLKLSTSSRFLIKMSSTKSNF